MSQHFAMDLEVRQELQSSIERITHTGNASLDPADLKKIKNICRQGDAHIRTTYELLLQTLSEEHAEVRLSTFQVISDLFSRSSLFRELLSSDFKTFASFVTGTDTKHPLPPPKDAAARLKKSSLLAIREWNQKYSHGYPKLKLGFNFLKFNKKVDFEQLVSQSEAERRRKAEREARQRAILQQRIQEVKQEMMELRQEVDGCLTEMDSCFTLLLPRFEMPDIYSTDPTNQDTALNQDTSNQDTSSQDTTTPHSKSSKSEVHNRKRTVSSCGSFVSLSEGSDSEGSGSDEEGGGAKHKHKELGSIVKSHPAMASVDTDICTKGDMESPESDSDSDVEWEEVELGSGEPEGAELLQEHGIPGQGFSVPIQLSNRVEVRETEDNSSIIGTLRERRQLLLNHHLPTLTKCMEWMTKAEEGESVKLTIDLKAKITSALAKYNRLNIVFMRSPPPPQEQLGEQVNLDLGQQPPPPAAVVQTEPEWTFGRKVPASVPLELDPTTPQAQLAILKRKFSDKLPPKSSDAGPSTEHAQSSASESMSQEDTKNAELLARAPVVPFGMDLYHWENPGSSVEPRTLAPVGSLHRFWAQETEINISKDEQDRLKCRTISFPGKFQPVVKSCRAPLPSGKLCPRRDRHKCPFHGPIIPRDETGQPVSSTGEGQGPSGEPEGQPLSLVSNDPPALWRDEELEEVMAAKGEDTQAFKEKKQKKKGGKRQPKYPGLTDLKKEVDTPRKRLERKVLSKRSLKRVAESVNELTMKKYNDKFGDHFNYALKN